MRVCHMIYLIFPSHRPFPPLLKGYPNTVPHTHSVFNLDSPTQPHHLQSAQSQLLHDAFLIPSQKSPLTPLTSQELSTWSYSPQHSLHKIRILFCSTRWCATWITINLFLMDLCTSHGTHTVKYVELLLTSIERIFVYMCAFWQPT